MLLTIGTSSKDFNSLASIIKLMGETDRIGLVTPSALPNSVRFRNLYKYA